MAINSIGSQYTIGSGTEQVAKSKGGNMDMDDFLKILTEQFKNQDMMDPVSDVEFIGQMAQFSTLQGLQEISAFTQSQHASAMVGKHVTVASTDSMGNIVKETGVVETVTFFNGDPELIINGKAYPVQAVMEMHNYKPVTTPDEEAADSDSEENVGGGNIQAASSVQKYTESSLSSAIQQASNDLYVGLPPELWPENQ